jgi:hypothetical protein
MEAVMVVEVMATAMVLLIVIETMGAAAATVGGLVVDMEATVAAMEVDMVVMGAMTRIMT